jgi:hypothetical protein
MQSLFIKTVCSVEERVIQIIIGGVRLVVLILTRKLYQVQAGPWHPSEHILQPSSTQGHPYHRFNFISSTTGLAATAHFDFIALSTGFALRLDL